MRPTAIVVSLGALLCVLSPLAHPAPIPSPPRNGKHTVQAMFGGRSVIPMCIVPPRTYVDGTPIAQGTQATIVVYRSMQEGKPGTYTQEVGRGVGPIEREWIDVGANVPCDNPNGGVIYLASSAIINGVESDLNNQYTTIIWSPGTFEVKEYPAAGSKPGPPASRKNQPTSSVEESYPEWMRELGRAASGGGSEGGYEIKTPPLSEFHEYFSDTNLALTIRFAADAQGNVTGGTDLEQFVALTRAETGVKKVEVQRNEVTGRLAGGVLKAQGVFALAVTTDLLGQTGTGVMTATTDLNGSAQGAEIRGPAHTEMQFAAPGDAVEKRAHDWQFVAQPTGSGGMALLAPDKIENVLGAPGPGFQTGGSQFAGGIVGASWADRVVATVPLDIGETHFFVQSGTPNVILDHGQWLPMVNATRNFEEPVKWFVGPGGVLEEVQRVGEGVRVRAIGNGMGEVWSQQQYVCQTADGLTHSGSLTSIWIVPVGSEARAKVEESQGKKPTNTQGPLPGVLPKVVITGRVGMKDTREPVADAQIHLIYPEGGAVYLPEWKTREDGTFRIVANAQLPGGGLPPNEYEVFVFKNSADVSAGPLTAADDALWPIRRYMVTVTKEAAKAGNIRVGPLIQMDYVRNIDFSRRETSFVRSRGEQ